VVVEPYIIYKAIYDNTFLDKEFLHFWCMYTDDKGAMCSTGVSLVSLWRPSCSLVVLIMYLVCIFLSKPLDSGNHESWYKAFRLFYYLIYGCCIVCLVPLFYPKA
jgi:hypothetical protein